VGRTWHQLPNPLQESKVSGRNTEASEIGGAGHSGKAGDDDAGSNDDAYKGS
jgi:hypothetical protein